MRIGRKLRLRLRSLWRSGQVQREMDEELAYHLQRETESLGTEEALRRFAAGGNVDAVREACRDTRGVAWIENLAQDARRGLRRLAASPAFSLTAVAVLALGVAAAGAMFSLCDAVLLRPLPGVAASARLVHLERVDGKTLLGDLSYPDFLDYQVQTRAFSALAATATDQTDIAAPGFAAEEGTELVTAHYFSALGVRAQLGRLLTSEDAQPRQNHVVVLSDGLWHSRFGGDADVVGRTLEVNRTPMTIVGVAAPGFQGASLLWATELWAPITAQAYLDPMNDCLTNRGCGWLIAFGQLAPGVGRTQAQAEVNTVAARIAAVHPLEKARRANVVAGLGSWSDDQASQAQFLGLLLAGTLLLLAMASASVGSLFLARLGTRQREIATQLALGAGRGRIAQQLLLEGGLLAAAATALGAAAAPPLAGWLLRLTPSAPQNLVVTMDARVLGFAVTVAAACALTMSLAPALLAARAGIVPALRQGGHGASARHTTQRWMLGVQVGIALLLLIAAGLETRTLQAATAGQVPARADHTVIAVIRTASQGYTRLHAADFFHQLQRQIAAQPGVSAAVLAACIPPSFCNRGSVFVAGTEPPPQVARANDFTASVRPNINWVGAGFFRMFELPLVAGRGFTTDDRQGRPPVCIINRRLAERLWPGVSPVGRQLAWPAYAPMGSTHFTVVGVIGNRRTESLLAGTTEQMYVPEAQVPFPNMWIAVQGTLPAATLLTALRGQVAALDRTMPLENTRTLAEQVRRSVWQPLAIAGMTGFFGLLAALLAAIGLFGALAQLVQERRRELGVRLALGATPAGLVWMVVRDGLPPIGLGLVGGALAAAGGTRLLTPWLYGVAASDWAAWGGAAALLGAVALVASWIAARQAAKLEPLEALRCE